MEFLSSLWEKVAIKFAYFNFLYYLCNTIKKLIMDILHIVVAETMGTDGEYYADVYPCRNYKDADDTMNSLIAYMAETMGMDIPSEDICVTRELRGDNWWFKVSDTIHENFL